MADLTSTPRLTTPLFNVPVTTNDLAPKLDVPDDVQGMIQRMPAEAAPVQQAQQPKKHGAIHNILSTLGDFLLNATGIGDIVKERRLNNAMQGFDQDPTGTIAKVSGIDYAVGAKLRDQYIDNQRLAASQAATAEEKAARIAAGKQAVDQRTRGYAASMLGSMATWDDAKRAQFYPQMRQQVLTAAQRQGLDLSEELPESFDPSSLDAFIDGAVPVGTQRNQRLTKDRIENQDKQAVMRDTTTRRGQDIVSTDKAAGRAVTMRGQDISHSDRVASRAASAARSAASGGRAKALGRYVGEDGKYRVIMSDGSERQSQAKVRPTGRGGGAAKPAEGMRRIINGTTYEWRGGKAVRVS